MAETNLQLGRYSRVAVREQAIGHRAVQQGANDPAVQHIRIAFEHRMARKRRLDGSSLVQAELQSQTVTIRRPADEATGMAAPPQGRKRFAARAMAGFAIQ
jgi:hypothetical protein